MNIADTTGKVAFDVKSLDNLKVAARDSSPESIKEVAKQFESIFMNMLMKSMRAASPKESPFENEQTRTFTSMLDQQLSASFAEKGLGLADIIAKQLSKGVNPTSTTMEQAVSNPSKKSESDFAPMNNTQLHQPNGAAKVQAYLSQLSQANPNTRMSDIAAKLPSIQASAFQQSAYGHILNRSSHYPQKVAQVAPLPKEAIVKHAELEKIRGLSDFKRVMTKHAEVASATSGIPSQLMLGQAALETGWGKRQINAKDGTPSYNLFGIKATGDWKGKTVDTLTTEYINGVKHKRVETFRAYDSYAESFKDFAKLMINSPRYQDVLSNLNSPSDYAKAMQKAGYATDPNYAKKLTNVIEKFSST